MIGTIAVGDSLNCGINGGSGYVASYLPYLYFGSVDSDHEHRTLVTTLTLFNNYNLSCLNGEVVSTTDITYLYGNEDCSLWSIGTRMFDSCTNISSVNLPNVTGIGDEVFYGCTALISVYLPNVGRIGADAFSSCSNLSLINISNKTMDDVKVMDFYPWGAKSGCIIKCSDGDITIS